MITLALLIAAPSTPTDLPSLIERMAEDTRALRQYRDAWILTTTAPGNSFSLRFVRSLDGPRAAIAVFAREIPVLIECSDGKRSRIWSSQSGVYAETTGTPFYSKKTKPPAKVEDGDFNLNIENIYDWVLSSNPALKWVGLETAQFEDKPARIVKLEVHRPGTDAGVDVKLTFPANSFVLARADATVKNRDGTSISFRAIREKVHTGDPIDEKEFQLPEGFAENVRKVEWKEVVPDR